MSNAAETTKHSLATKLTHVAAACGYVQKDASNSFHKYRYVSAANILGHVNEALCAHGLAVVETEPTILSESGVGKERVVTVRMRVVVQDADTGERAVFVGLGSGQDAGDKAVMKASTAATKYAWLGALSISTGDDPEADTDTDKRGAKPPRGAQPPAGDRSTARTMPAPPPPPASRVPTDLEVFRSRFAGLSTRYDAAQLWVDWRERLHATGDDVVAWADIAETFAARGWDFRPAANPRAWLKSAAAEIANRTTQKPDNDPTPNGPNGGTRRAPGATSTEASGSAQESHGGGGASVSRWEPVTTSTKVVIDTEEGARLYLAREGEFALINSFALHRNRPDWQGLVVDALAALKGIHKDVARLRLNRSLPPVATQPAPQRRAA